MIRKIIPYVFWAYAIALLIGTVVPWSTTSRAGIGEFSFRIDYWLHFLSYFGLSVLFILMRLGRLGPHKLHVSFFQSWIILVFAFLTEVLQYILPARNFNINDFIANSIGFVSALLLCFLFRKLFLGMMFREFFAYKMIL